MYLLPFPVLYLDRQLLQNHVYIFPGLPNIFLPHSHCHTWTIAIASSRIVTCPFSSILWGRKSFPIFSCLDFCSRLLLRSSASNLSFPSLVLFQPVKLIIYSPAQNPSVTPTASNIKSIVLRLSPVCFTNLTSSLSFPCT